MALVQCQSPVSGTTYEGDVTVTLAGLAISTVARTGETYSWRVNPSTTGTSSQEFSAQNGQPSNNPLNVANATYRFYFRVGTLPASGSEEFFAILDTGSAYKMAGRLNSTGTAAIYASNGTTLLGTTVFAVSTGTWYRAEVQCGTGASAAWEFRIYDDNDSPTLLGSISGTGNLSTSNHRGIKLGKVTNRNGQTVDFYYSGLHIRNDISQWCGHSRFKILQPDGAGTDTAWTGTWQDVDEGIPHDAMTTTINSATTNTVETVTLQSSAAAGLAAGDTINCVKAICMAARASLSPNIGIRWRSGGNTYDSTGAVIAILFSAGMQPLAQVREVDPATSAAWTHAGVDALEIGPKYVSGTGTAYVTAIWCMVDYVPSVAPPATPRVQVIWA